MIRTYPQHRMQTSDVDGAFSDVGRINDNPRIRYELTLRCCHYSDILRLPLCFFFLNNLIHLFHSHSYSCFNLTPNQLKSKRSTDHAGRLLFFSKIQDSKKEEDISSAVGICMILRIWKLNRELALMKEL